MSSFFPIPSLSLIRFSELDLNLPHDRENYNAPSFFLSLFVIVNVKQVVSLFLLGSYYIFFSASPVVAVVALLLYVGCYQVNIVADNVCPKSSIDFLTKLMAAKTGLLIANSSIGGYMFCSLLFGKSSKVL